MIKTDINYQIKYKGGNLMEVPVEKKKLNIDGQIAHMKEKNIRFSIVSDSEAKSYLHNNSYYFRIKAYAKNYDKYSTKMPGKYIGLEFAYLQELSKLDMLFREVVLKMTIDIEHYLKLNLLRDFSSNVEEDGYSIVKEFFEHSKTLKIDIEQKVREKQFRGNSYCKRLVTKYVDHPAIWNIVEVLSFGDFIRLFEFYYTKHKPKQDLSKYLWSARMLRNATAHNNCLLNILKLSYLEGNYNRSVYYHLVSKIPEIKQETLAKMMANTVVNDFIVSLHLFCEVVTSNGVINKRLSELHSLFHCTFLVHKDYFSNNNTINNVYKLVVKIVDHYYKLHYSSN